MPRKGPAPRRELMPDPIYRSVVVTQLVNKVLVRGQRSTAERIVYAALEEIGRKTQGDPVAVLKRAVENVRPQLEVRRRLAGELMDASNGIGASIKRREDLQKMAESNKAFAHYRW